MHGCTPDRTLRLPGELGPRRDIEHAMERETGAGRGGAGRGLTLRNGTRNFERISRWIVT
eukprot:3878014-Prymnesium_polylepis.1